MLTYTACRFLPSDRYANQGIQSALQHSWVMCACSYVYMRRLGLALQQSREGHRPNAQLLYAFMDNSWGLPAHKHASRGTQSARGGSERGKDELTGTTTGPSCTETSRGGGLRCLRVETVVDDQYAASHCCENNLDQLRAAARRCNVCAAWFRPSRGKREHTRG